MIRRTQTVVSKCGRLRTFAEPLAVDQTGSRWFVTVSDLAAPWVPDLSAAMQTAAWLAGEGGLEFVVAPVPTTAGQIVGSLDSHHALTLSGSLRTTAPSGVRAVRRPARQGPESWRPLRHHARRAPDALSLYRLRWGLDDIAEFLSEIRGPHQRTADTLVSWTVLKDTLKAIAKG